MAEERATKRYKNIKENVLQQKKGAPAKEKSFTQKRENKFTLSTALDEEALDGKERRFASDIAIK